MKRFKITATGEKSGETAAETIVENNEAAAYKIFDDYCRAYAPIHWNDYKIGIAEEKNGEWEYKLVRKFTTV